VHISSSAPDGNPIKMTRHLPTYSGRCVHSAPRTCSGGACIVRRWFSPAKADARMRTDPRSLCNWPITCGPGGGLHCKNTRHHPCSTDGGLAGVQRPTRRRDRGRGSGTVGPTGVAHLGARVPLRGALVAGRARLLGPAAGFLRAGIVFARLLFPAFCSGAGGTRPTPSASRGRRRAAITPWSPVAFSRTCIRKGHQLGSGSSAYGFAGAAADADGRRFFVSPPDAAMVESLYCRPF